MLVKTNSTYHFILENKMFRKDINKPDKSVNSLENIEKFLKVINVQLNPNNV